MIKALIFDNNGVMTSLEFNKIKEILNLLGVSKRQFILAWHKFDEEWSLGKINSREFIRKISVELGCKEKTDLFYEIFHHCYEKRPEMIDYVLSLGDKYQLALLTNFGTNFDEYAERWGTYEAFDKNKVFISSSIGIRKPAPEIYKYVLNKLNVAPNESIFIDDNIKNILAAKRLGIKSIHFTTLDDFKNELEYILENDEK